MLIPKLSLKGLKNKPLPETRRDKKILILSASVGGGHIRAAEAVEAALKQLDPSLLIRNVDVLDLTNAPFRRLYGKFYFDLFKMAPHMVGYLYDWLDRPARNQNPVTDRLRLLAERINLRRFLDFLQSEPWDGVVNTHFLPAEMVALLRRKNRIFMPQMTVTTDFETHRLWVNHPCDRYFVATPEGAEYLRYWGIPPDRISVTGIPIHPAFSQSQGRAKCLERHRLDGNKPVILQLAGGFGVGSLEQIFRSLMDVKIPCTTVVVTGRNQDARKKLFQVPVPSRHRVRIIGFTREMDEFMAAADLVVSKPGGLTSSECLARGVPMVIVNPIPGQEQRNSDHLLEQGAAIKANNIPTLSYKVTELLLDRPRLRKMRENCLRAARPNAAFDIGREVLNAVTLTHKAEP